MGIIKPLDFADREALLRRRREAIAAYTAAKNAEDFEKADPLRPLIKSLSAEYFERLPRGIVSCCPFCSRPLRHSFDPFGLDGLWWDPDTSPQEPPACPHFCVLSGAVGFNGLLPRAGEIEVLPGPEVPYVMPRLLNMPGMVAVISRIDMANGYVAYPIAYFAERRPPPQDLTPGWGKLSFSYKTQLETTGWASPNDMWDFGLRPWLDAGKIRCCDPKDTGSLLPPNECPYIDLPGRRTRHKVQGERLWSIGLPDGIPFEPWD